MEFTINGVKWGVYSVREPNKLQRSDGTIALGVTDWNDRAIYISDFVSDSLYERVLCHEITHAFCFSYNVYLPIETEEMLCNFMAEYGRDIINLLDEILYNVKGSAIL